jgi:hypothetical protein
MMMTVQTASHVLESVENNPDLQQRLKDDPVKTLKEIAGAPLQTDVWIYRMVVGTLGFMGIGAVLGAMLLAFTGKSTPEVVTALGSAAVGALAGLLAPSPSRQ